MTVSAPDIYGGSSCFLGRPRNLIRGWAGENKLLRPRPFTPTERVVAWLLAAGVAAFAATGLALGLRHHRWLLVVASVVVLSVAALYMAAAWRGRPF